MTASSGRCAQQATRPESAYGSCPLWDEYYEQIKSDIADMKNTGGRAGGVITAAALLSKFVQKYPWVHLDIAATAWTEKERPYTPKGATGIGVRLLTKFLQDFNK